MAMKQLVFSRAATRTFSRMPANSAALVRAKIEQLMREPASLGNNVKAIKGHKGHYRLRVGDWRVVYAESADTLHVLDIGPRGSIYD